MNKYILLMLLCLLIGCRNQGNDVVIKDIDDVYFYLENKKNPEKAQLMARIVFELERENYEEAEKWYLIGANQGNIESMLNLGIVYFLSQPSAEDDAAALAEINKLYQDGVETGSGIESFKNNKNDSLFVLAHSETGFNPNYFEAGQLPEGIRNQVAGAAIGQTFGPYKEQNYYVVSKLLGKKTTDSIRSRHILISYQGLQTAQGEAAKRTTSKP